jgi:hypothetical protein
MSILRIKCASRHRKVYYKGPLENITRRQNMTEKMNENFSASWYANNTKNKA